jgi:hypothetical protein
MSAEDYVLGSEYADDFVIRCLTAELAGREDDR